MVRAALSQLGRFLRRRNVTPTANDLGKANLPDSHATPLSSSYISPTHDIDDGFYSPFLSTAFWPEYDTMWKPSERLMETIRHYASFPAT